MTNEEIVRRGAAAAGDRVKVAAVVVMAMMGALLTEFAAVWSSS